MKKTIKKIDKKIRKALARLFPGRFPKLYSTTDDPIPVPVQMFAYDLAIRNFVHSSDRVLDVGFGAGFGLMKLAKATRFVNGIDIDNRAVLSVREKLDSQFLDSIDLRLYDGRHIPYEDHSFETVVCVDVIEHVEDYEKFLYELLRVAKRSVFISTPNRRPEFTAADGKPLNYWHLREWSFEELHAILDKIPGVSVEWNMINGSIDGPFTFSKRIEHDTVALCPVLLKN